MSRRLRIGFALVLCMAGVWALAPSAHANGACGTPPCYTEFTVDGGAPPPGVSLNVMEAGGMVQAMLVTGGFNFELSPALSNDSVVHYTLNLGEYDPAAFVTTGLISSYSATPGSPNMVSVDASPRSSAWNQAGCRVGSCGDDAHPITASHDYNSMLIGAITDLRGAPSPEIAYAMHGTWIATNAQAFSLPMFNTVTQQLSFSVAAPHFKSDGTTINTGFFRAFLPDALVSEMGIPGPAAVNVTNSTGGGLTTTVTHVDSPASGLLIDASAFNYSSPTFKVVKGSPTDATLRKLTISAGHLTPSFSSSQTSYNAGAVGFNTKTVKVTPTATQSQGKVQVRINNGAYAIVKSGQASKALALNVGVNKVYVRVTAPNKTTTKTYAIAISRNSAG
jgi:hypothetical protein